MTCTAMNRVATVLGTFVLLFESVGAQQLPGLIDQNIKSAQAATARIAADSTKKAPQLWIHVRTAPQMTEAQGKVDWFKTIQVSGQAVDVRPIQIVNSGPQQNQLRFFRPADRAQAQALLTELKKAIPVIALQDMSSQYRQASWIDSGHFELWLAPSAHISVR